MGSEEYEQFLLSMVENIPVLIPMSLDLGVSKETFVSSSSDLLDVEVPVDVPRQDGSVVRKSMLYSDFLHQVLVEKKEGLYVKDWHINNSGVDLIVPFLFEDDWLNWYFLNIRNKRKLDAKKDESDDDYSFAYVGSRNTFTPVHHDVCYSYSWSFNISGYKRWTMWPPNNNSALFGHSNNSNNSTQDQNGDVVKDARKGNFDKAVYPSLGEGDGRVTFLQQPGEAIFVPSGWYVFK